MPSPPKPASLDDSTTPTSLASDVAGGGGSGAGALPAALAALAVSRAPRRPATGTPFPTDALVQVAARAREDGGLLPRAGRGDHDEENAAAAETPPLAKGGGGGKPFAVHKTIVADTRERASAARAPLAPRAAADQAPPPPAATAVALAAAPGPLPLPVLFVPGVPPAPGGPGAPPRRPPPPGLPTPPRLAPPTRWGLAPGHQPPPYAPQDGGGGAYRPPAARARAALADLAAGAAHNPANLARLTQWCHTAAARGRVDAASVVDPGTTDALVAHQVAAARAGVALRATWYRRAPRTRYPGLPDAARADAGAAAAAAGAGPFIPAHETQAPPRNPRLFPNDY